MSYVEVFFLYILKLGELEIDEPSQLDALGNFRNIKRLMKHMKGAYPIDINRMIDQE